MNALPPSEEAPTSDVVLSIEGVHFSYLGGPEVLSGVDLNLARGEVTALVGASGSGKSTLLSVAGLLATPDQGSVRLGGHETVGLAEAGREQMRNRSLGFIFQHHFLLPDFTAAENVAMPRWIRSGRAQKELLEEARALLGELGLGDLAQRFPHQLSGGERQRVAISRALFHQPRVLLADEPTGSLDSENGERVLEVLLGLRRDREVALMLVTHNHELAARCDRQVIMIDGRLCES